MEKKYYKCERCGQIIEKVKDTAVPIICCGAIMQELVAGAVDAAVEKHVPAYQKIGNIVNVKIASVEHPMTPEHYIEWICLETKNGSQTKKLSPTDKPEANFYVAEDDEVVAVYEYCNLHGLWKA